MLWYKYISAEQGSLYVCETLDFCMQNPAQP